MTIKKKTNKWKQCIGCYASFDNKGKLIIFSKVAMYKMNRMPNVQSFIVYGEDVTGKNKGLIISNDGCNVGFIKKKHCKIL
jgi:hypothetical protein